MKPAADLHWDELENSDVKDLLASLKAFIRSLTVDKSQADDIFQETVLRTKKSKHLSELDSPLAYMITVSKTVLYDFQKKNVPQYVDIEEVSIQSDDYSPSNTYLNQQKLALVDSILLNMSPLRREIFVLRRVDGLARDDIARRLDVSVEVVKKHLTRAMVEITVKLEEAGWLEDN
ncbi:RNA polymerase sigma factor [Alteromonas mediterranea]|uniref:RNA polymerase sigma factor n=1 Tax=Alteromonas mediterranea TaxID=314275 RepID=UPI0012FCBF18|nr:RNA polymerase sigma factor [Alteromonas mediterranea]QGX63115.1 sigma-70 family RNA polymerase sigma factor [Alteromonas mediterranea]